MNTPSVRPDCSATLDDDLMVCDRCGLEWLAGADKPACNPITFEMLRARILKEATNAEASLNALRAIRRGGVAADVEGARRRATEIDKIRMLVDRCTTDAAILALIKPFKRSQPAARAGTS